MLTSYTFADAQRLAIKPFERTRFVVVFVFVTIISERIANYVASQPAFVLLGQDNPMQYSITAGIIFGTLLGAVQWLVIRKYFPDWKWILVVGIGTVLSASIQTFLNPQSSEEMLYLAEQFSQRGISPAFINIAIFLIFILIFIGIAIISGYLQWYVLQPYVAKARWWIFLPLISSLVVGGSFLLVQLFSIYWVLKVYAVLASTVSPMIPAIGFCLLKKKSGRNILQSALALTPDIVNYWDVRRLDRRLYENLARVWKTDLTASIGRLTYLVGINRDGSTILYEPLNPISADNVNQTSLPAIGNDLSCTEVNVSNGNKYAKFQVIFAPPGIIQIRSWRGVPLLWISLGVSAGILGLRIFITWAKTGGG